MTARCGPTTSATPIADGDARSRTRIALVAAALLLGACDPAASDANARSAAPLPAQAEVAASAQRSPPATVGKVSLSGRSGTAADAAVMAEAKRQGMTGVEIASAQSFRVLDGAREVAALVTGKGSLPGTINAGCFAAVVQGGQASLIPTIGYADYEAETCSGPASVGLLTGADPVRLAIVFDASSPNAQVREPVIISWDRGNNTLSIDDALSSKASEAGAVTIPAIRKAIR